MLLDTDFNIKLADFGFARHNMIDQYGKIKTSVTFCGTAQYAAPEVLNGIPYQPDASDVWSIGIVLYYMLFGRFPFNGESIELLIIVCI